MVSIPLSRGSLCNIKQDMFIDLHHLTCFNPSVEGKPLQPDGSGTERNSKGVSIPLSRGSLCNTLKSKLWKTYQSFNPSVEGKPLQQQQAQEQEVKTF